MTRAVIDQDIVPTDYLLDQLPAALDPAVGLPHDEAALTEALAGARVAVVTSRIPLSRAVLTDAPDLEIVAKLGTGIDNVDVDAARELGIDVTYTPGFNALSVAEHTLGLALAASRRLTLARATVERGGWRDDLPLGSRISGSTVGIVGFGNIGKRFGKLLSGFETDVLVTDPYVPTIDAELVDGEMVPLATLLERSDLVCISAELTDETRRMIGERELDLMKDSAVLVNTARGPVVDEAALIAALETGTIAGAGLDVFADEPLSPDSPLFDLENVVLTPHISSMTIESRHKTIDRLSANLEALLSGEQLPEWLIPGGN